MLQLVSTKLKEVQRTSLYIYILMSLYVYICMYMHMYIQMYLKKLKANKMRRISVLDETLEDSVSRQELELTSSSLPASPFFCQVFLWEQSDAQPFFPPRRTTTFLWFHAVGLRRAVCEERRRGGGGGV